MSDSDKAWTGEDWKELTKHVLHTSAEEHLTNASADLGLCKDASIELSAIEVFLLMDSLQECADALTEVKIKSEKSPSGERIRALTQERILIMRTWIDSTAAPDENSNPVSEVETL